MRTAFTMAAAGRPAFVSDASTLLAPGDDIFQFRIGKELRIFSDSSQRKTYLAHV